MAEQADFDGEGVAVADGGAVEMFVLQRAEEPLDYAVGLWAPHPCADVPEQRVVAGEHVSEGHATKAWPVVRDRTNRHRGRTK